METYITYTIQHMFCWSTAKHSIEKAASPVLTAGMLAPDNVVRQSSALV